MTDSGVCESYALDDVITTVDTVTGLSTIEKHPESVRQIAVADRIILTKTDLAPAGTAAICKRISSINPSSPVTIAINGVLDASTLFRSLGPHSVDILESVSKWMPPESANGKSYGHQHTEEISTFCIVREQPLHGVTLALLLSALADNCGADLLRMKGIVAITKNYRNVQATKDESDQQRRSSVCCVKLRPLLRCRGCRNAFLPRAQTARRFLLHVSLATARTHRCARLPRA